MSFSLETKDIRSFIEDWNIKYPIDRWWRQKFGVAFGSKQHLEQSMIDMRIAYEEDRMYEKIASEVESDKEFNVKYVPGSGNWLKKQPDHEEMTAENVDDVFETLASDLDALKNIKTNIDENGKRTITL